VLLFADDFTLATAVPSPPALACFAGALAAVARRRRDNAGAAALR
jgi:hypothetical protein